jgi:small subunit ribosomal protein S1
MVDYTLLRELAVSDDDAAAMVEQALGSEVASGNMDQLLEGQIEEFAPGRILEGTIVGFAGDDVVVEVGLKSEGLISKKSSMPEELKPSAPRSRSSSSVEGEGGIVQLSKRKADRIRGWQRILDTTKEGDIVEGTCHAQDQGRTARRHRRARLPPRLAGRYPPPRHDIGDYIGRRSAPRSSRSTPIGATSSSAAASSSRTSGPSRSASSWQPQGRRHRQGTVKNIADFGAFVDLGGIDGLLHITDMSWGRVNHPSDIVKIDEKIEVKVLNIDYDKEKIALGLKQKESSPWEEIERTLPGRLSRISGEVVNIMSYGAFVRSRTASRAWSTSPRCRGPAASTTRASSSTRARGRRRRPRHRQEQAGDQPRHEADRGEPLGTRQPRSTRPAPSSRARSATSPTTARSSRSSPASTACSTSPTCRGPRRSRTPTSSQEGREVKCVVLDVDQEKQRISLGVKQLTEDPWLDAIPDAYQPGMVVRGKVTKITNFGVFVELEDDLEGLLHISELADHKVENPQDVVKAGEEVDVKILRVDISDRKIGLSLKRAQWGDGERAAAAAAMDFGVRPTCPARGGMDEHGSMGTDKITKGWAVFRIYFVLKYPAFSQTDTPAQGKSRQTYSDINETGSKPINRR